MSAPVPLQPTAAGQVALLSALVDNATDLMVGIKQVKAKLPAYQEADRFYSGGIQEVFASARLQKALERTGIHYKVNIAKTPVDTITDRLEIVAVHATPTDAQVALDAIWKYNGLDEGYTEVHRSSGKFGDEMIFVWPSSTTEGMVDVLANDPTIMTIVYDTENPAVKKYAVKLWQSRKDQSRCELLYRDRIEKYVTKPNTKGDKVEDWVQHQDPEDEAWPLPNPWDEIPVFHMRTRMPWGIPEHYAAYGCQNAVNKLVITHLNAVDYQGHPQRWALADPQVADEDDLDEFGTDDAQSLPEPNRKSSHQANFRSGPGEVWYLKGVKDVGQFAVSDGKSFLDPASWYMRMAAQLTDTPLHYFDPSGTVPSGESLKVADQPLVKKAETRQSAYTSTWTDVAEFALRILGIQATVTLQWAASGTTDERDTWSLVGMKIAAGIPPAIALVEAGYDPDLVKAWGVPTTSTPVSLASGPAATILNQPFPANPDRRGGI